MRKNKIILFSLIAIISGILFSNIAFAENVMIQADKQSFNVKDNLITFEGNVKVDYNNISVKSPKAFVKTGADGKPEAATFLKGAEAVKNDGDSKSEVKANIIKLSLLENKVNAEGNTKSVILEKQKPVVVVKAAMQEFDMTSNVITATGNVVINYNDTIANASKARITVTPEGKPDKVDLVGTVKIVQEKNNLSASNVVYNPITNDIIANGNTHFLTILDDATPVSIWSDYQQYNKGTNTLIAGGKVKILYKDYTAYGPKAIFLPDSKSLKPNQIVFTGRSRIQEGTRQVEANKIEITINPKSFTAEGSVKTKFTQIQDMKKPAKKNQSGKKAASKETNNLGKSENQDNILDANDVETDSSQQEQAGVPQTDAEKTLENKNN